MGAPWLAAHTARKPLGHTAGPEWEPTHLGHLHRDLGAVHTQEHDRGGALDLAHQVLALADLVAAEANVCRRAHSQRTATPLPMSPYGAAACRCDGERPPAECLHAGLRRLMYVSGRRQGCSRAWLCFVQGGRDRFARQSRPDNVCVSPSARCVTRRRPRERLSPRYQQAAAPAAPACCTSGVRLGHLAAIRHPTLRIYTRSAPVSQPPGAVGTMVVSGAAHLRPVAARPVAFTAWHAHRANRSLHVVRAGPSDEERAAAVKAALEQAQANPEVRCRCCLDGINTLCA